MVSFQVIDRLVKRQGPEMFTDEHYSVQLCPESRWVPRRSLHEALPHTMTQPL